MKHENLDALRQTADVVPVGAEGKIMTRRERLERWATLIERHQGPLRPLARVEYLPADQRASLRGDDTPAAVAFRDPVFRAAGLVSDTYGDIRQFFELSEHDAHHILCSCHYPGGMTSARVASRMRSQANRNTARELWYKARDAISARLFNRH